MTHKKNNNKRPLINFLRSFTIKNVKNALFKGVFSFCLLFELEFEMININKFVSKQFICVLICINFI